MSAKDILCTYFYTNNFNMKTQMEEVVIIKPIFFKKPYYKQRSTLRLLIWWSIKHYFKILFK